jgi:hypothetical protein
MVISMEAVCVDIAILLGDLTSKVALQKPVIRSTDPNILIGNNCPHDEYHSGCQGAVGITKLKLKITTCAMPNPPPASDDGP